MLGMESLIRLSIIYKDDMIKFYSVDENYIDTLKTVDKQVPNIKYDSNNKFFCGIVLKKKVLHGIIGIEERSGGNITNFV